MLDTGATLGRESGVRDGEFIVALDVSSGISPHRTDAIIRLASRVEAINARVAKLPPSASQYRKAPVADKAQLAALQQRSKQIVAAMPLTAAPSESFRHRGAMPIFCPQSGIDATAGIN